MKQINKNQITNERWKRHAQTERMILGKINDASHKIIKDIGLCNCRENNAH